MLKQTFIHIPGVGYETEHHLWQHGITCWKDFLEHYEEVPLPERKKCTIRQHIEESIAHLKRRDHSYFATRLPKREYWRAYPEFNEHVAYLDIETTGLSPQWNEVTLIGLYDGKEVKTFINGLNLGKIEKELKNYSIIVTYNGARFDLPFLAAFMPHIRSDLFSPIHIDLLYPLRRMGYRGGLKAIEHQLGLKRDPDIATLSGYDAVRLWYEYKRGSKDALQKLIKYNSADLINLKKIMEFVYESLKKSMIV